MDTKRDERSDGEELDDLPTMDITDYYDFDEEKDHDSLPLLEYSTADDRLRHSANARLQNPLAEFSDAALEKMAQAFCTDHFISDKDDVRAFRLGAILARDPTQHEKLRGLATAEEMDVLAREMTHRWSQPWLLYLVIVLCSTCAAVQGMDESVVNGAQLFYADQFGIGNHDERSTWLVGLVNSAPYLCCAFIGSWLTVPFNATFGRRGTIFFTCLISALACLWQGFVGSWWHMFIARFALGLGIGPKSATVPVYAAECTPSAIRGALVMQWQMWTAFGIMIGYAADLAFYHVPDQNHIVGLNWRLMMASAMVPAVIVCCFVFLCPESPRWYMSKGRHLDAYKAMCRLRYNKIQAARDVFYMSQLIQAESQVSVGRNKIVELVRVPRNRRAMIASEITMFMQQFCGINVIAYYSSTIFVESGFSEISALSASMAFGVLNFLFALPAVYTIDTFGRRNLLLTTFPLMAIFLLFTGFSFFIPLESARTARIGFVATGIYLFAIVYSPGAGPVPFTYSAEAYPLYVREYGMALATATTWFFNFVLSITWPSLSAALKPQGAFSFYAMWNIVGFLLVLFFVAETKGRTLEELDAVFSIPTSKQAAYGWQQLSYWFRRYARHQKSVKPPKLYE